MTRPQLVSPTLTATHLTVTALSCAVLGLCLIVIALRQGGLLIALTTALIWWLSSLPAASTPLTAPRVIWMWLIMSVPGVVVMTCIPLLGVTHPLIWLTIAADFALSAVLLRTLHAHLTQLRPASSF